jgi:hypothetical protein
LGLRHGWIICCAVSSSKKKEGRNFFFFCFLLAHSLLAIRNLVLFFSSQEFTVHVNRGKDSLGMKVVAKKHGGAFH